MVEKESGKFHMPGATGPGIDPGVDTTPLELKRAPGTCCPEPECDYVSFPATCRSCGADCKKCERRRHWLKKLGIKVDDEKD